MALSNEQRAKVTAEVQRRIKSDFGGMEKAELRALVDGMDAGADIVLADFESALTAEALAQTTREVRTQIFGLIILERAGML